MLRYTRTWSDIFCLQSHNHKHNNKILRLYTPILLTQLARYGTFPSLLPAPFYFVISGVSTLLVCHRARSLGSWEHIHKPAQRMRLHWTCSETRAQCRASPLTHWVKSQRIHKEQCWIIQFWCVWSMFCLIVIGWPYGFELNLDVQGTGCPKTNALSGCCWSYSALVQSLFAGNPCAYWLICWSFLAKTKQDRAPPIHHQ